MAKSKRKTRWLTAGLLAGLLGIVAFIVQLAHAAGETGTDLYEVYTRDANADGILEILVMSSEPVTAEKLVLMIGGGIRAPIVVDNHRRAIRIDSSSRSGEHVASVHPSYVDLDDGWSRGGLKVIYGDITGDHWQDMLLIGTGGGNSYTLSWDTGKDQLVVQQILEDEKLKFYISEGYEVGLEDMNADSMDDLVISADGEIADIVLVTADGTFFTRDMTPQSAEATAKIAVNTLLDAAKRGDMESVVQLAGREAGPRIQEIRDALGDEVFLEELARVKYAVPARVGVNYAQYELAAPAEDGTLEFFPLTLERSRNGLWKIEVL